MARMIIACLLVSLAGCAAKPVILDKAGTTPQSFAQDRYQCQQETLSSGNYTAIGAPLFVVAAEHDAQKRQRAMFIECMEARGYVVQGK